MSAAGVAASETERGLGGLAAVPVAMPAAIPVAVPVAVVPKERVEVRDGQAVKSATRADSRVTQFAVRIARAFGVSVVANVQVIRMRRRQRPGTPTGVHAREDGANVGNSEMALDDDLVLIEVNPKFASSLPLTVEAGVNLPLLLLEMQPGRVAPWISGGGLNHRPRGVGRGDGGGGGDALVCAARPSEMPEDSQQQQEAVWCTPGRSSLLPFRRDLVMVRSHRYFFASEAAMESVATLETGGGGGGMAEGKNCRGCGCGGGGGRCGDDKWWTASRALPSGLCVLVAAVAVASWIGFMRERRPVEAAAP